MRVGKNRNAIATKKSFQKKEKMGAKFSKIKMEKEKKGRERFESVRSGYIHHSPALQNDLGD